MARADQALAGIAEAARASSGRSKLARWFRAHHDEFRAVVEETQPRWEALAQALAEAGMTTAGGKAHTAEAVRVSWYRVRKSVEASRAKRTAVAVPVAVERPDPPSPVATAKRDAPKPSAEAGAIDPLEAKRRVARLRREMAERSGRKYEGGDE